MPGPSLAALIAALGVAKGNRRGFLGTEEIAALRRAERAKLLSDWGLDAPDGDQ